MRVWVKQRTPEESKDRIYPLETLRMDEAKNTKSVSSVYLQWRSRVNIECARGRAIDSSKVSQTFEDTIQTLALRASDKVPSSMFEGQIYINISKGSVGKCDAPKGRVIECIICIYDSVIENLTRYSI